MRILIACEYSGVVREAFAAKEHDVWSCDLEPTDIASDKHYQGDVSDLVNEKWDMMIAFPPCTHLATSGARWFPLKQQEQKEALDFVRLLMYSDIPKIAIENPLGVISTYIEKPTQIIQPYYFGEPFKKRTCLWLKNLPILRATKLVTPNTLCHPHTIPPGKDRGKLRSKTFQGIADAMAAQWG